MLLEFDDDLTALLLPKTAQLRLKKNSQVPHIFCRQRISPDKSFVEPVTRSVLAQLQRRQMLKPTDNTPRFIREVRERIGLTQEKFAAKLGVTFPTVNRWEHGRAKPSPLALKQIENLLRKLGDKGYDLVHEHLDKQKQ
jgi:DNA-binding transcriptional regulator YiaG